MPHGDKTPIRRKCTSGNPEGARGLFLKARKIIEDFIYEPTRVKQIMRHFNERALKSDKALIEYIRVLLPKQDATPGITVNVVSSLLDKGEKIYDIDGKPLDGSTT